MNENFPLVEGNCNGYRTLYHPDGEERFQGFVSASPDDDVTFSLENPWWLNIDDRIGIVFSGTGKTVYINRHYFKPYRAIADDLYLSVQDENRYSAGDTIAELAFLLCPEQSHDETPNQRLTVITSKEDAVCFVCLITPDYLCAALLLPGLSPYDAGGSERLCKFDVAREDLIPIYSGIVEIEEDCVQLQLRLRAGQAFFSEARFYVKTDGTVRVEVVPEGTTFLTNTGSDSTEVHVLNGVEEEKLSLEAGQTARIEIGAETSR
jgi:hypothetical protein